MSNIWAVQNFAHQCNTNPSDQNRNQPAPSISQELGSEKSGGKRTLFIMTFASQKRSNDHLRFCPSQRKRDVVHLDIGDAAGIRLPIRSSHSLLSKNKRDRIYVPKIMTLVEKLFQIHYADVDDGTLVGGMTTASPSTVAGHIPQCLDDVCRIQIRNMWMLQATSAISGGSMRQYWDFDCMDNRTQRRQETSGPTCAVEAQ